jgi:L-ribulose-5-phosphate 4-epimerase
MSIAALKETVLAANKQLVLNGLVLFTWGNVSAIDRKQGLVVIKPAGYPYEQMTVDDLCLVTLSGEPVSCPHKPAVDLPTHLVLYRQYPEIGGIAHTHSTYATTWAQACRSIPCLGTTHADYFYGEIPCTRSLQPGEVMRDYEEHTGVVICEAFSNRSPIHVPGVLVANHGPFTWGKDAWEAVHNSTVLEEIARMALYTLQIDSQARPVPAYLLDAHFQRKHGPNAYFDHEEMMKNVASSNNQKDLQKGVENVL